MKNTNNTQITSLFEKYCGNVSTATRVVNTERIVNGEKYFLSQYSNTWQHESKRCGKKHRYTKEEIAIWNKIYRLRDKIKLQIAVLEKDGKLDEAKQVENDFNALWLAKDRDASLYESVKGFTTAELDALEKSPSKSK